MSEPFPATIHAPNGREYQRLHKTGTNIATGQAAEQYACTIQHPVIGQCESRLWLLADGTIEMDD